MTLDLGQWIVIGLCAALVIGYIHGYYYNRQKAEKILSWLRPGLEKWGKVTAGEKLAGMATGGRLTVLHAVTPFQRIEAIYLLEPRENLLFWLFHRLQGRRDELVLKITLPKAPRTEIEVKRRGRSDFTPPVKNGSEQIGVFLEQFGRAVFHLALRRGQPHLFVRAYLTELMSEPAEAFLQALQGLA